PGEIRRAPDYRLGPRRPHEHRQRARTSASKWRKAAPFKFLSKPSQEVEVQQRRVKQLCIWIAGVMAALVIPATAQAHVTLQPAEQPADEFVRADVRVPNERDDAGTTKVEVQFPSGFLFASYQSVPGWKGK